MEMSTAHFLYSSSYIQKYLLLLFFAIQPFEIFIPFSQSPLPNQTFRGFIFERPGQLKRLGKYFRIDNGA